MSKSNRATVRHLPIGAIVMIRAMVMKRIVYLTNVRLDSRYRRETLQDESN